MSHNIVFLARHPHLFVVLILTFLCLSVRGQVLISNDSVTNVSSSALLELRSDSKTLLLTNLAKSNFLLGPWEKGQITYSEESGSTNGVTNNLYYYSENANSLFGWSQVLTQSNNWLSRARDVRTNSGDLNVVTSYYLGAFSGNNILSAAYNTSLGASSMRSLEGVATYNTAVGYRAEEFLIAGMYNSALGAFAGVPSALELPDDTLNYTTAIGYNAKPAKDHQIMMGTGLETVQFPNKVNFTGKDSLMNSSEGDRGDLYVHAEGGQSNLYFKDTDSTWNRLNSGKYQVGDIAHGGVVFWVDATGEHGLVCAPVNLSEAIQWRMPGAGAWYSYADGDGMYAGDQNTTALVSFFSAHNFATNPPGGGGGGGLGAPSPDFAAHFALKFKVTLSDQSTLGDWYLPSREELIELANVSSIIEPILINQGGEGFFGTAYWSSTEANEGQAYAVFVEGLFQVITPPTDDEYAARAIRRF